VILTDKTIQEELASGRLKIEPLDDQQIGPASVDLRLGTTFLTPRPTNGMYSMSDPVEYEESSGSDFIVPAHGFVLATTNEFIALPNDLTAFVEGRSSVGRLGLFIQNAGWVDPGFEGAITLELFNANHAPMRIEAGRRICQLVIARADGPVANPYSGKYQGQQVTTGSRIHLDTEVAAE
jgi:dCTP deaminase